MKLINKEPIIDRIRECRMTACNTGAGTVFDRFVFRPLHERVHLSVERLVIAEMENEGVFDVSHR